MQTSNINLAGRISHFFAVNRPLSMLLLVVAVVFGLVSFFLTPKQYNPEITRPAFAVSVAYEGATVAGAVDRVVYELVEKIDTVPGVDDIHTTVHDGARIHTTVIFEVGYDAMRAKLDLRSQLAQHSYLARGHISEPHILEINPETIPVLQIVFGSGTQDLPTLREQVTKLAHELSVVPEVSALEVHGGYEPAMVVTADLAALAANELTLADVTRTLTESQMRTVTTGVQRGVYDLEVVFDGVAASPETIGDLVISGTTRIRDVATVYRGAKGERSYVFYEDAEKRGEVVLLSVAKVEGASAPVVTDRFLAALDARLAKPGFANLEYAVVSNDGETATREIFGLTQNLLTSIAIVAAVLLLFLSSRAALVVLVAIPTTLLVVFGLGLLFDQTINRITLFALILSLGLLVDSAIVATENIYAHLKRWRETPNEKTKEQVIATAVDEIGVGLLLSTITSVIVFLPMHFITGMMGPYMGPISFFVPAALVVSFLVAIVVTPFVASHVLRDEGRPNRFRRTMTRQLARVTRWYTHTLRAILSSARRRRLLLRTALGVFVLALVLPLTGLVHFQMLPRADRDQFYLYLDLPVDTDREATRRVADKVASVVLADSAVVHTQQFVATPPILDFNGMFKGAQNRTEPHQATIRINLMPATERDRSSTEVASGVRAALRAEMPQVISAVRIMEEPPGPPVRATLVAKVSAADMDHQRAAAAALQAFAGEVEGVVDIDTSEEAAIGRVRYVFDHAAADALGVSPAAANQAIQLLDGGREVVELLDPMAVTYTPVMLRLSAATKETPHFVDAVPVMTTTGETVPLGSVLQVVHEVRPSSRSFEDARPVSYVTAEVEGRSIVYVVIDLIRRIATGELAGYTLQEWNLWGLTLQAADGAIVELRWGGEWEMTLENFRDLGIAMGVALLMVYALLVAQYKRFSTPAYILVTVPLGLVGILFGFLVLDAGFDIYLTATALIGFIALIGLVVNNAIIFLEYVEQARRRGLPYQEALVAAGEARLRPIFLTSLTTVLGSLTIASDPVWSGLAWAIIFGLSLSTLLTLIIYPTLLATFVAPREAGDEQ